jgi:hypothetical protein
MKITTILLSFLVLVAASGCMNDNRFLVEYDYSYKGNSRSTIPTRSSTTCPSTTRIPA